MPVGATLAQSRFPMTTQRRKRCRAVALAALSVTTTGWLTAHSLAATDTWIGNTSDAWNNGANWSTNNIPKAGDALVFGVDGTAGQANGNQLDPNLGVTFTAAGITFLSNASSYLFIDLNETVNLAGNITDNSTDGQFFGVNVNLVANTTIDVANPSENLTIGVATTGNSQLTKTGAGTLTLTAPSTFTGTLSVGVSAATSGSNPQVPLGGGTVALNFATNGAPASNILGSTSQVNLNGSTLEMIGGNSTPNSQTLAGLQVQAGFSTVEVVAGTTAAVLNVGTISLLNSNLDNKAAQVNFELPSGPQTTTNGILTNNTNASGILISNGLAAYTVNSTDWATNSSNIAGHNIIGLSQSTLNHYTAYTGSATISSTANLDIQKDGTISNSATNLNSCQTIRFNMSATTGLTDMLTVATNNTLTITAGGLLITPNVGATNVTIAAGGGTSTLRGASNTGLSIFQYDTLGTLTINTIIADNNSAPNALTIGGGGAVVLTAANTYSNSTTVQGGSNLEISGDNNLGSTTANGALNLNNGTLTALASFSLTDGTNNRAIGLGTYGGTIDVTGTNTLTIPGVISDSPSSPGTLTKTDTGTLILSNTTNSYTGGTIVDAGTLVLANGAGGSATGTGNVTLNGGVLASSGVGGLPGSIVAGTGAHIIAPGGIGTIGTLAAGGLVTNALTNLNFDLGSGAGPDITNGDLLTITSTNISIGAGTQISVAGATTIGDDYRLIGDPLHPSAISSVPLGNFSLPTAPLGQSYSLSSSIDSGYIDLVVGLLPNLTWNNAGANSTWDTATANWNNGTGNATFANGDDVNFTDANGGAYNVTLNTTVKPGAIVVNNSSGNYTIGGLGSIAGAASLTKSGVGAFNIDTVGTSLGAVSITGGLVHLGTSTGLTTITSLSISGSGAFDINNNHVIIDYGSGPDPIASIAALLKTGYFGGNWDGAGGIISSAAQLNNTTPGNLLYGVGYADSADPGNPAGLSSGTIEIKYTLLGDANLSGVVDGTDFGIVAANFNKGVTGWDQGDFNYDNVVDGTDFGDLAANFNKGASGAAAWQAVEAFAAANGLLADVPEPASAALLALGAVGILGRRRRKA